MKNKRLQALTVLTAIVVSFAAAHTSAAPAPAAAPAQAVPAPAQTIPEPTTRAVQLVLKSFGYTIAVDGSYGPQTTRIVKSWQRSNGLAQDGVAGPVTRRSLGLEPVPAPSGTPQIAVGASSGPSTASRGTQIQVTDTLPPPPRPSVEQMIRDIWPDDLEAEALRIAWRESNYKPGVTSPTGCCHGVFQINWPAHRSWLGAFGVTTVDQLFDAETNIRMAYELYKRSNGWGPWRL